MGGHFSTGQSPHWAVVPMEEELYYIKILQDKDWCKIYN